MHQSNINAEICVPHAAIHVTEAGTYVEIIVSNRQCASLDLKSLIRTVTNRNSYFRISEFVFSFICT